MIDKPGCMEALKEVERLLDGELEGELRIKVEKHLSGCSPCMDRAEFRRHLKVMIAAEVHGRSRRQPSSSSACERSSRNETSPP